MNTKEGKGNEGERKREREKKATVKDRNIKFKERKKDRMKVGNWMEESRTDFLQEGCSKGVVGCGWNWFTILLEPMVPCRVCSLQAHTTGVCHESDESLIRLAALRACRPLPTRRIPSTNFC